MSNRTVPAMTVACWLLLALRADATILSNGTDYGAPYGGSLCADVAGGNASSGTHVQVWKCYGGLNQQFSFLGSQVFIGTGGFFQAGFPYAPAVEILAMGGAKCLDAAGSGTSPGTTVGIWDCNRTPAQAWEYTQFGQIINVNSGLCLDATNQSMGTQLVTNFCTGEVNPTAALNNSTNPPVPSQVWQLKSTVTVNGPPGGGPYDCADVAEDSNAPGTKVQVWECHAGPNQQFALEPVVSGSFNIAGGLAIYALGGTMCVSASSFTNGSPITIQPCTTPWMGAIWDYDPSGDLLELHNFLCLDATNGQNGTQLVLNPCGASNGNSISSFPQMWLLE